MPTYQERLTANNLKIDEITTLANTLPDAGEINDKLDAQDEIIENLKSALDEKAGKGGAKLNVFTQLTEPTTKKGIWLQTNKQMEHFVSDDSIFIGGTWTNYTEFAQIPYVFNRGSATSVGTDIYLLGGYISGGYGINYNYKYDTLTNTYTKMANIPTSKCQSPFVCTIGTDIYIFGGYESQYSSYLNSVYKYDTLTDTYTTKASIPNNVKQGPKVLIGDNLYAFNGRYRYKYSIANNAWTQLSDTQQSISGSLVSIGDTIYGFSGNTAFKYYLDTDTKVSVTDVPISDSYNISCIGNNVYIFQIWNSSRLAYVYNTVTDTYTQLESLPYNPMGMNAITNIQSQIYIIGGQSSPANRRMMRYNAESKSYETDNVVVVAQGRTYDIGYNIELLTTELAEEDYQPLYGFADAWFYTLQDGLDTTIPTYYGNGTQWINIKNPPSNNNE